MENILTVYYRVGITYYVICFQNCYQTTLIFPSTFFGIILTTDVLSRFV